MVRALFTSVLMAVVLLVRDRSLFRIRRRDLWLFLATAFFDVTLFNYCYFTCIALTSMPVVAVLLYTSLVFVMLFSALFYHEKITPQKIAGIALTVAGYALVTGAVGSGVSISFPGLVTGMGAALGFSLYPVISRKLLQRGYHSLTITFFTFFLAALILFPFADWGTITRVASPAHPADILRAVGLAISFRRFFPTFSTMQGLKYVENSRTSIIAALEPVTAPVLYNGLLCSFLPPGSSLYFIACN